MKQQLRTRTPPPGAVGIVVRRGARRRFDALKRKIADLPAVVTWDRRQTERRASSEPGEIDQRKAERRQKPPYTWEVADFVVVDGAAPKPAPTHRLVKGTKTRTDKKKPV